jgi:hypothetical protein
MNPAFIPGAKLCEQFYQEAVRPILSSYFPQLRHSAALIGAGSEVLGFDDELSTDHHWGPRVMLFVEEASQGYSAQIIQILAQHLPYEFHGYSTNFTSPDRDGVQVFEAITKGPVNHRVTIQTMRGFFLDYLNFDIDNPLEPADWLSFSEQHLRTITSGLIYHDEIGLAQACARFTYYPHDVWLYLLAAAWSRIGQEEHLMGRAGIVGDEVGSALIAGRLVRDIMRLCFLMEKTYAPYPKWFGSAFKKLQQAEALWPLLQSTLCSTTWQGREEYLVQAYEHLAIRHNMLKLTEPLPEKATSFFGRPFRVIELHGFADSLVKQIEDPVVKKIAAKPLIGNLDLLSDNTEFLSYPYWRPLIRQLYE